jgi:hypothetical protein
MGGQHLLRKEVRMKKNLTWKQLYALSTKQERGELVILMIRKIEERERREAIEQKTRAMSRQILGEISEVWSSLSWVSKKMLRLKFEWFLFVSSLQNCLNKKARSGNRYIT